MPKYDKVGSIYKKRSTDWGEVVGFIVACVIMLIVIGFF